MNQPDVKTCGFLRGNLSELLPCIFLYRIGVALHDFNHDKDLKTGIFCMRKSNGYIMNGVILPLVRCRDEKIRSVLLQLHTVLARECVADGAQRRRVLAQEMLDSTFGGAIRVADKAGLDGMIEFARSRDIFRMFAEHFDYVTEIVDASDGAAQPTRFEPFPCKSYGEFLEWYYERMSPDCWSWQGCYPALVFEANGYAGEHLRFPNSLERPQIGLNRFFDIKPDVCDKPVSVELTGSGGWLTIQLCIGSSQAKVVLSSGFSHLEHFIELLKSVKRGDVPVEFEFEDDDMFCVKLSVLATGDPQRVFLRIVDTHTNNGEKVQVEAIVNRHQLVEVCRTAIRNFFRTKFDPVEWYKYDHEPVPKEGHIGEMILADPWFDA
jgi:hypothetical protein